VQASSEAPGGPGLRTFLDNGAQIVATTLSHVVPKSYDKSFEDGEIEARVAKLDLRKRFQIQIGNRLIERGLSRDGKAVRECSSDVTIRKHIEGGQIYVRHANYCQKRILCCGCEHARSMRTMSAWLPKILQATDDGGFVPVMLTLTVKNGTSLSERAEHLLKSLTKGFNDAADLRRRKRPPSLFGKIEGSIWHAEMKKGSGSKLWHPHLHGLCLVRRENLFTSSELSGEWLHLTGDSFVVDASVTNFGKRLLAEDLTASQGFSKYRDLLLGDLCEVLKYCIKFDIGGQLDDVIDAHYTLKNKRLARSTGCLRGLKLVDKISSSESLGTGEYLDYILSWSDRYDKYKLKGIHAGNTDDEVRYPSIPA